MKSFREFLHGGIRRKDLVERRIVDFHFRGKIARIGHNGRDQNQEETFHAPLLAVPRPPFNPQLALQTEKG